MFSSLGVRICVEEEESTLLLAVHLQQNGKMSQSPSETAFISPTSNHALGELAQGEKLEQLTSSAEELRPAIETGPSFETPQNSAHGIERKGRSRILGDIDYNFHEFFVHKPHPRFPSLAPLDIAFDRYLSHDGFYEPTNPHNTPASNNSDCSFDTDSDRGQNDGHKRVLSASGSNKFNFGWLNDDSQWSSSGHAVGNKAKAENPRTQPLPSEVGLDILGPEHSACENAQPTADNTAAEGVEHESPPLRSPQFSPSPSRFIRSPHIRFVGDHPARRRFAYNLQSRRKKSLWRPVSLHQRHPQRVSYRSPARTYHVSISHPDRLSSVWTPSVFKLPCRQRYLRQESIGGDSQVSEANASAEDISRKSLQGLISKSYNKLICSVQTKDFVSQKLRGLALISVSLHKSQYSTWPSPSGSTSYVFHVRMNWSIARPTIGEDQINNSVAQIAHMDGISSLGQINFIIPVIFLRIIEKITVAGQDMLSSRVASRIINFVGAVMSLITALVLWVMGKLWMGTVFQFEVSSGAH